MKKYRSLLLRAAHLILFAAFALPLTAAADTDREEELKNIQARIAEVSENLAAIRGRKDELQEQLGNAETDYGVSVLALKKLMQQAVDKRRDVVELRNRIVTQKRQLSRQSKDLEGVIRSAYALGQKDRLKMILNQQDPALSSRMLVYYRYMHQSRLQKLAQVSSSMRNLQVLEEDMRQQSEHLNGLLELQEFEQAKLAGIKNERKALLERLNSEYADNRQKLEQLQESERQLQGLLGSLREVSNAFPFEPAPENHPFAEMRGLLPWPVRGKLLKNFGSPRDEGNWDGVLIEAREGTDVRAVSGGRVIYADWLRGYGLLLIIDHEQGYMTLYAFNQSLYKRVGDIVEAGEIIGAAGESGGRDESGLYFGIRKDGKAVDPVEWCRNQG